MKIKTNKAIGPALDWLVGKAEGTLSPLGNVILKGNKRLIITVGDIEEPVVLYCPSTDWAQGGPIIDREDISFRKYHNPNSPAHGTYYAKVCRESGSMVHWSKKRDSTGPTALIAAMRCYVASKLGDTVEVPEELL